MSYGDAPVLLLVVLPALLRASHLKQETHLLLRGEHDQIRPEVGRLLCPHDDPRQEERSELPPKLPRLPRVVRRQVHHGGPREYLGQRLSIKSYLVNLAEFGLGFVSDFGNIFQNSVANLVKF